MKGDSDYQSCEKRINYAHYEEKTSSVFPAMAASHRDTDILLKTDLAYSVVQSYRSVQKKKKISHVSRKKNILLCAALQFNCPTG